MKVYKEIKIVDSDEKSSNNIIFTVGTSEVLRLCENGDIFVNGVLAENNLKVVEALKEFLIRSNCYAGESYD